MTLVRGLAVSATRVCFLGGANSIDAADNAPRSIEDQEAQQTEVRIWVRPGGCSEQQQQRRLASPVGVSLVRGDDRTDGPRAKCQLLRSSKGYCGCGAIEPGSVSSSVGGAELGGGR